MNVIFKLAYLISLYVPFFYNSGNLQKGTKEVTILVNFSDDCSYLVYYH